MRRHAPRPGLLPLSSAVLLSLAAGLSLADEHMGYSGQIAATPAPLPAIRPAPASLERGTMRAAPDDRAGAMSQGVGSRALTGSDAPDAAPHKPADTPQ
jgi:hypothetical protein